MASFVVVDIKLAKAYSGFYETPVDAARFGSENAPRVSTKGTPGIASSGVSD
jgi:hypothetical protein